MTQAFDPFDPDELIDARGCDPFEIAIDMRAQGALAAQAVPMLEAHLEACEFCRQYRDRAGQVDAALATHATAVETTLEWQRIQQKLSAGVNGFRRLPRQFLTGMAIGFIGFNLLGVAFGHPVWWISTISVLAVAVLFFATYFWNLRRVRGLLEQRDVIASYRGELERRLMAWRRIGRFAPIAMLCWLFQAVSAFTPAVHGNSSAGFKLAMNVILFFATGYSFVSHYRLARSARRELTELR